ncbi:hypothetical protein PCANC_16181 [Puccinia coronata f. sp. avenae]|uniref:non-specific serine/threonine protein kinase n=1 Tax=Puccinia coronata f. sp. avenae TaxID=200324 RepID=A0A2N5SZ71_9BASI|nr:hypothetical protein PCANC_16181 [Puccinia coronata f. sp. avenae]
MDSNKNVHFKPSSEQLRKQGPSGGGEVQPLASWPQRHAVLSRLGSALGHTTRNYEHRTPATLDTYRCALSPLFGYLLESAQQQKHSDPQSAEQKLLQRCLSTGIDPARDFILLRTLSEAQSGSVYLIKTRLSSLESLNQSNLYILKKVSKRVSRRIQQYSSIQRELSILLLSRSSEGTPKRLPTLHASFQTATDLHLLVEYSPSGSIADYLAAASPQILPEQGVLRSWTIDAIAALHWLHHTHHFCHRDIKPSNLLIHHHDAHILLADFATAAPLQPFSTTSSSTTTAALVVPRHHRTVIVGTCDYIAPEVLQVQLSQTIAILSHSTAASAAARPSSCHSPDHGHTGVDEDTDAVASYGPEVDFWSFGVSLYELVYGKLPFFCQSISDTYSKIVDHQSYLEIPHVRCRSIDQGRDYGDEEEEEDSKEDRNLEPVSGPLQSFLKALLCSRENRIGCGPDGLEEVKRHEWFRGLDWDQVQRIPVPNFTRSPINISRLGDSVCLDGMQDGNGEEDGGGFHFSAFFGSSPGLSALKMNGSGDEESQSMASSASSSNGEGGDHDDDEEGHEWGFTYLPADPDEFNVAQEDYQWRQKLLKSSIKRSSVSDARGGAESGRGGLGVEDDRFSTPIKPARFGRMPSAEGTALARSARSAPHTGLGCRSVRLVTRPDGRTVPLSHIDQLMKLNQHVLSTARKSQPSASRFAPPPSPPNAPLSSPHAPLVNRVQNAADALALLVRRIDSLIARSDSIIRDSLT